MTSRRTLLASLTLLALLTGFLPTVLQFVPELFADGNAPPSWFPMLGSVGETITYSLLAARVLGILLSPVLALLVGYWTSDAVAVATETRLVFWLYLVLGLFLVLAGAGLAGLAAYEVVGYYPRGVLGPADLVVDAFVDGLVYGVSIFAGASLGALQD